MSSSVFVTDTFVFDPRPAYPFLVSTKRYKPRRQFPNATKGLTLVFTHGVGFHKELWEPTLEDFWERYGKKRDVAVRELWTIDCPNAGESAVLNEEALRWGYDEMFGWDEYGRVLHLFVSGLGEGLPSRDYFRDHDLVGVGHSMGNSAVINSLSYPDPPKWRMILLVEPVLLPEHVDRMMGTDHFLTRAARNRKDLWSSREEAYKDFMVHKAYRIWDPRVLKLYCDIGLRDLPTLDYPDKEGVTLKCSKFQEIAMYMGKQGMVRAYKFLSYVCANVPVHVIFGTVNDVTQLEWKKAMIEDAAKNRFTSIRKIEGAGHLVIQTHPKELADKMHEVFREEFVDKYNMLYKSHL